MPKEITLPNGDVVTVEDDQQSYQVTVSLPGGYTTTANAVARDGETASELTKLLAGSLEGREGYAGATNIYDSSSGLITDAEKKAQELINAFQSNQSKKNLYTGPTATEPLFDDGDEEYVPTLSEAKNLYPYYPESLVQAILDVWTDTGEITIAISEARASDTFEKEFPGIKRPDGSLRMTEIEYLETKDYMADALRTYNLNPGVFGEDIAEAIAGDVSAKEFTGRLGLAYQQLVNNIPQVKEIYLAQHGLDLTDEAIFAMFVSPEISESVLQNQVLVSQISAEAEVAGLSIGITTAQQFVQAGIDQKTSRQLFGQTSQVSEGLQLAAASQGTSISEQEIATGLAGLSPEELSRIRGIQATATSEMSTVAGSATTNTGQVIGLEEA
tara:strand:+ start:180 stop:1337 length:1158 start_codon:yes stop_codon:yes gene_type:complete